MRQPVDRHRGLGSFLRDPAVNRVCRATHATPLWVAFGCVMCSWALAQPGPPAPPPDPAPPRPEDAIRTVVAAWAVAPPTIDGRADDAAWADAWPAGPFVVGDRGDRQAEASTRIRVLYDAEGLYILGEMGAAPGATMFADGPARTEQLIAYLDPYHDHRHYVEMVVDSRGATAFRAAGWLVGGPELGLGKIEVKTSTSRSGWTAELRVPFEVLHLWPTEGQVLGLNVVRDSMTDPERQTFLSPSFGPREAPWRYADLPLGLPKLRLRALRVEGDCIGTGRLVAWLGDMADPTADLVAEVAYSTPFGAKRSARVPLPRRPKGTPATILAPFPVEQSGRGVLDLSVETGAGEVLYQAQYAMVYKPEFVAPGAGRFAFVPERPVAAPGESIAAHLSSVTVDRHPVSHGDFIIEATLLGHDGQAMGPSQGYSVPHTELGCTDCGFRWTAPAAEGAYSVRVRVSDPMGRELGAAQQMVLVDRATTQMSKLPVVERAITVLPGDDPFALSASSMVPSAWRTFVDLPFERAEIADSARAIEGTIGQMRSILSLRETALADPLPRSETYRMAYRSSVDDSIQPYALYVPASLSRAVPAPIIIYLHGWDGANTGFGYPAGNADAMKVFAADHGWLVVYPFGRGNQDWRDAGETDLREVLQAINRRYPIDFSRLYLVGESMGGRGVWHLGMRYPADWAALVPIAGAATGSVWGVWNEERFAQNVAETPTFVVHGTRDDVVPVRDARILRDALARVSPLDFHYRELPFGGHGGLWEAQGEWLNWLVDKRTGTLPRSIRFSTESVRFGRAFFFTIEQLEREGRQGTVDVSIRDGNWVNVLTEGVRRLSFRLAGHPALDAGQPVTVTVDDSTVLSGSIPGQGTLTCERSPEGAWQATDAPIPPGQKQPKLCGPMRDVLSRRFCLVYGSLGEDCDLIATTYRLAQQAAQGWRDWWWGTPIIKRDVDVTETDMAAANLVLFGGPEVNAVAAKVREHLPLTNAMRCPFAPAVAPVDVAYKYAYPNPLAPGNYILIMGAVDPRALEQIAMLAQKEPYPSPLGTLDVDYLIAVKARRGSRVGLAPVAEGWFDNDWQFPTLAASRWVVSGRGWQSSAVPTPGWLKPGFTNPAWGPAAVRSRIAMDNDAWQPFFLRDFRAVLRSFSDRTEPIWHVDGDVPARTCYLRHEFDLGRAPGRAPTKVLLEDRGRLYVNGELVCDRTGGDGVLEIDVASRLRAGTNVIGIEAGQLLGSYGAVVECHVDP